MPPLNPYVANLLPPMPALPNLGLGSQAVAAMLPDERDSMLSQLGGQVMSGVGAASNALDTLTGGRYVRNLVGLLTGNEKASFGELFTPSIIGLGTDLLGLTSHQDSVQPEDLTGSENPVVNLAVGALLDPGTYLSGGGSALTKIGRLGSKAGILDDVAGGLAKQMGRKAGTVGPRLARTQGTLRMGLDAIEDSARYQSVLANLTENAAKQGLKLDDILDQPIGGLMRWKMPFLPEKMIGSGAGVADLAESLDAAGRYVGNLPGIRNVRAVLDKSVKGATSALGQSIGRIMSRREEFAKGHALRDVADVFQQIETGKLLPDDLGIAAPLWSDDFRRMRESIAPKHFDPATQAALQPIMQQLQGMIDVPFDDLQLMGAQPHQWQSLFGTLYNPRQSVMPDVSDPLIKGKGAFGSKSAVPTSDRFAKPREEMFDLPGGSATISEITRDPELVGRYRTTPGTVPLLDDAQAAEKIRRQYLNVTAQTEAAMQKAAKDLEKGNIGGLRRQFPQYAGKTDDELLEAVGKDVATHNTLVERSDSLARSIGNYHPWYATSGKGLYGGDPLEDIMRYGVTRRAAVEGVKTVHNTLADWATDILPGQWPAKLAEAEQQMGKYFSKQATREPHEFFVPLTDALKSAGLADDAGNVTKEALNFQAAKLSERLGRAVDVDELSKMYVPRDVVEPLTRTMQAMKNPEEVSAFFSASNKFTNLFKTYALLRPSFFTRNLMSGAWTNYILDAHDPRFGKLYDYRRWLQPYADARALVKGRVIPGAADIFGGGMTDAEATRKLANEMFAERVSGTFATQAGDFAGASGDFAKDIAQRIPGAVPTPSMTPWAVAGRSVPKSLAEANPLNTQGVRSLGGNVTSFVREGQNVNQYVEDLNRLAPYIAKRRQGIAPSEAARQVRVAHVDYQHLTDFERKYAKSLVPFYTYTRGVLPWLVQNILENPGGANRQAMRFMTEARGEGFLPDYLAQTSAIPLPDWVAGESDTGSQKYLTGFDLPIEQLNTFSTGPGLYGTIKATGNNLIGMTNPLLKTGMELITGRSFFQQGRPLEELEPTLGRLAVNAGLLDDPREIKQVLAGSLGSPIADELIAMSPIAPTLSIAKQVSDSRKSPLAKAVNIATGARVQDVDMERQKSLQARKLLEDSLRGQPGIKAYEHIYSNKADFDKLSPEDQRRYLLYNQLSDEAIKKAREKKRAG